MSDIAPPPVIDARNLSQTEYEAAKRNILLQTEQDRHRRAVEKSFADYEKIQHAARVRAEQDRERKAVEESLDALLKQLGAKR